MKTFEEVITAFEEAGIDVRQAYWSDGTYIDLVLLVEGRRFVVSAVAYHPIGTGVRGEIVVGTKALQDE